MIVAITGHRSEKCEDEGIVRIKSRVKLQYTPNITTVITGMANGVDLWAADEARLLGIEVWAAKPWAGHKPRKGDEALYALIMDYASEVVAISDAIDFPGKWVYPKRNEWMVDHADAVMAYWDGSSGGTKHCRDYAKKVGKPIANIYLDPPF